MTDADLAGAAEVLSARRARRAASKPASKWRLRAVLVSPEFLFRVEQDPAGVAPEHRLSHQRPRAGVAPVVLPLEQHPGRRTARRRRSQGKLRTPAVLEQQVRRMLADSALASAGQQLRRAVALPAQLASITPDMRAVPGLRRQPAPGLPPGNRAVLREHHARGSQRARPAARELHVSSTNASPSITEFPTSTAAASAASRSATDGERGGLLRQGSILTVTSYATRTSPVIRGKWILANILGAPPPPPPPNVPALEGQHRRRQALSDARAPGRASRQSRLRRLPSS